MTSNACEECTDRACFRALLRSHFTDRDDYHRHYPKYDKSGDKLRVLTCLQDRGYVTDDVYNFDYDDKNYTEYELTGEGLRVYGIDPKPVPIAKKVQASDSDMLEKLSLPNVGDTLRIGGPYGDETELTYLETKGYLRRISDDRNGVTYIRIK